MEFGVAIGLPTGWRTLVLNLFHCSQCGSFICLNGSNYAQWAQAVEVFLLSRKKFDYVINEPPVPIDPKFANWRAKDAQIRSFLWNSMESKISCSLVFLPTAKLVWE